MIITCPRCLATYTVPDHALGAQGRKMRCSSCHFEWQETPPPQEAIANLAPAPIPTSAQPRPTPAAALPRKTETTATKPKPPAKPKAEKNGSTTVIVFAVLAAFTAGLILMRNTISDMIPAMEDVYEGVGLPIGSPTEWFTLVGTGVESSEDGNRFTLTVHGEISNISKRDRELPPIRITWYSKDGTIGSNTVVRSATEVLAPGEKARFIGILPRVDTSTGGEVRMVPWLGSEAMVVTPGMESHNNLTGQAARTAPNAASAHEAPAHEAPAHEAPAHEAPALAAPAHEPPATPAPTAPAHESPAHEPATHEAPAPDAPTTHEPAAHEPAATHETEAPTSAPDAVPHAPPEEGGHH